MYSSGSCRQLQIINEEAWRCSTGVPRGSYPDDVKRQGLHEDMKSLFVNFFLSMTFILSGAKRNTRNLGISKAELERELFAVWPQLLRELAKKREPPASGAVPETRFQQSLTLAVESGRMEGFSETDEYKTRKAFADQQYYKHLAKKRGMHWSAPEPSDDAKEFTDPRESEDRVWYKSTLVGLISSTFSSVLGDGHDIDPDQSLELDTLQVQMFSKKLSKALGLGEGGLPPTMAQQPHTVNDVLVQLERVVDVVEEVRVDLEPHDDTPACPYLSDYHVPSMRSFWRVLKQSKIRYTRAIHAHECPLHTNGPLWVNQLNDANKALNALPKGQELERVRLLLVSNTSSRSRLRATNYT
jgi:hypothetical protein